MSLRDGMLVKGKSFGPSREPYCGLRQGAAILAVAEKLCLGIKVFPCPVEGTYEGYALQDIARERPWQRILGSLNIPNSK